MLSSTEYLRQIAGAQSGLSANQYLRIIAGSQGGLSSTKYLQKISGLGSGLSANEYLRHIANSTGGLSANGYLSIFAAASAVPPAPENSVLPVVSGNNWEGQTLSTTNGTWSNTPTSYTYQWTADGTNIVGATSSTYVLATGQAEKVVRCVVTAHNAGGTGSATSAPTATIMGNPLTIFGADLAAWYDPSDIATVTKDGSNLVSQLNDKSGNNYHLTAATTARPTYNATGILNHVPGLFFNGTANIMSCANVNIGTTTFGFFTLSEFDEVGAGVDAEFCAYAANGDTGDFSAHSCILWHILNGSANYTIQVPTGLHPVNTGAIPQAGVTQPHYTGEIRCFGSVFDGSNIQVFISNQSSTNGAYTPPPFVSPGTLSICGRVFGPNTKLWKGYMGETIVLKRAPTPTERARLHMWLIRSWTTVLVCEGDSITHEGPGPGFGAPAGSFAGAGGFSYISVTNTSPKVFLDNIALGGTDFWTNATNSLWDRRTTYTNGHLPTQKYGKKYVLFFTFANNMGSGLHNAPSSASDYVGGFVTYSQNQKAAGWDKIVIATALDRTDQETTVMRNSINAIIQNPAWVGLAANGGPIDAIADFASDSIMGVDNAPTTNPTYFKDGVHPATTGHARLEPIFTAAINSI